MQKIYLIIVTLFSLLFPVSSCSNVDDLDGLEGQWQLVEWKDAEGTLKADKSIQIYYRFQLGLIDFHKVSLPDGFSHACFKNVNGMIHIYDPYVYVGGGHSKILPMDTLSMYGVPYDGKFKIEELTSKKMVLSSPEAGVFAFRKY